MDESQTAFASQYPPYGFDIEMMKVRPVLQSPVPPSHPSGFRGLWIPQVVPIPKKPVGPRTPSAQPTEETVETLATPSPTTATGPSRACPRVNSTGLLPTDSVARYTLPHPSPSTLTPETVGCRPNSARTPVAPHSRSKCRHPSVPTPTPRISVSATTCWPWVFPDECSGNYGGIPV